MIMQEKGELYRNLTTVRAPNVDSILVKENTDVL